MSVITGTEEPTELEAAAEIEVTNIQSGISQKCAYYDYNLSSFKLVPGQSYLKLVNTLENFQVGKIFSIGKNYQVIH